MPGVVVERRRARQPSARPTNRAGVGAGGGAVVIQIKRGLAAARPGAIALIHDDRARDGGLEPVADAPTAGGVSVQDLARDENDVVRGAAGAAGQAQGVAEPS